VSAAVSDKPDTLLLDEMFSPAIADGLAARGVDCRAVVADIVLRALSDLEIFEAALLEGRVIVTNNVPDFESLRRARDAVGGQIPGLIYTSDLAFPRTKAYVSRLVTALEAAAVGHETARHGGVLWLRPPGAGLRLLSGRPVAGVAQHPAQVHDHLLVDVLVPRRIEELLLAPEIDLHLPVMAHRDRADVFEQRQHRPPLDVVAGGVPEDLAQRVAVTVVEVFRVKSRCHSSLRFLSFPILPVSE
jgi:hypothetical protein